MTSVWSTRTLLRSTESHVYSICAPVTSSAQVRIDKIRVASVEREILSAKIQAVIPTGRSRAFDCFITKDFVWNSLPPEICFFSYKKICFVKTEVRRATMAYTHTYTHTHTHTQSKTCLKRNGIVPVIFSVFRGFHFTQGCVLIKLRIIWSL